MLGLALSVDAAVAGFALVVGPILLLATIWAVITTIRILFPEQPLPLDGPSRRERALRRGTSVPVHLRDILEDEARRRTRVKAAPTSAGVEEAATPVAPRRSLTEDLWLRRN